MRAQRKNSKLDVKVFFKVLKFLSLFFHIKMPFFYKNISKSCGGGVAAQGMAVLRAYLVV
jgi:hypothetical protein